MTPQPDNTIGLYSFGDLGSALADLLRGQGIRVVTCCSGRSERTVRRAQEAGAEILPGLRELVSASDLFISVVPPSAAVGVAEGYLAHAASRPSGAAYVDLNSISESDCRRITAYMVSEDVPFIDATIHGGAKHLEDMAILFLSGANRPDLAELFGGCLQVSRLGDAAGQATRMKLLIAGLSKSLNALFLDNAGLAAQCEMLPDYLKASRHFYPGLMDAIERMLPTYPLHAARRVDELENVRQLAEETGSPTAMFAAARDTVARAAKVDWAPMERPGSAEDLPKIIRRVQQQFKSDRPNLRRTKESTT
jgi:3-hydroxyisobutyrate dehydrogenase-like beta-hydroxyacid dehydrogenase